MYKIRNIKSKNVINGSLIEKDFRIHLAMPNNEVIGEMLKDKVNTMKTQEIDDFTMFFNTSDPQILKIEKDNEKYILSLSTKIEITKDQYKVLEKMLLEIAEKAKTPIHTLQPSSSSTELLS